MQPEHEELFHEAWVNGVGRVEVASLLFKLPGGVGTLAPSLTG